MRVPYTGTYQGVLLQYSCSQSKAWHSILFLQRQVRTSALYYEVTNIYIRAHPFRLTPNENTHKSIGWKYMVQQLAKSRYHLLIMGIITVD